MMASRRGVGCNLEEEEAGMRVRREVVVGVGTRPMRRMCGVGLAGISACRLSPGSRVVVMGMG